RLDPGQEFAHREGLGQVVVGADLQPDDTVHLVVARGEHQDRHGTGASDVSADIEAVDGGEHDVEDDQVGRVGGRLGDGGLAVGDGAYLVTRLLEVVRDRRANTRFILDDEDPCHIRLQLPRLRVQFYQAPPLAWALPPG